MLLNLIIEKMGEIPFLLKLFHSSDEDDGLGVGDEDNGLGVDDEGAKWFLNVEQVKASFPMQKLNFRKI